MLLCDSKFHTIFFIGVSLGVIVAGIHHISDAVFLSSAEALANMVTEDDLKVGRMYPPLTHLRYVLLYQHFLKCVCPKMF